MIRLPLALAGGRFDQRQNSGKGGRGSRRTADAIDVKLVGGKAIRPWSAVREQFTAGGIVLVDADGPCRVVIAVTGQERHVGKIALVSRRHPDRGLPRRLGIAARANRHSVRLHVSGDTAALAST